MKFSKIHNISVYHIEPQPPKRRNRQNKLSRVFSTIESSIFNTRKLFHYFYILRGGFGGFQGLWKIYIKIMIMQFCSSPSHISLCKYLSGFNSKYGHERTYQTTRSKRYLVGSWKCLLYFIIYLFIESIYVLIFTIFLENNI